MEPRDYCQLTETREKTLNQTCERCRGAAPPLTSLLKYKNVGSACKFIINIRDNRSTDSTHHPRCFLFWLFTSFSITIVAVLPFLFDLKKICLIQIVRFTNGCYMLRRYVLYYIFYVSLFNMLPRTLHSYPLAIVYVPYTYDNWYFPARNVYVGNLVLPRY